MLGPLFAVISLLALTFANPITHTPNRLFCGYNHCCYAQSASDTFCWGVNYDGQLGNGGTSAGEPLPTKMIGVSNTFEVACAMYATCVVEQGGGEVKCSGDGSRYAHGQGSTVGTTDVLVPTTVTGLTGVSSIGCGDNSCCAVFSSGGAKCWGRDGGLPTNKTQSITPEPVSGFETAPITEIVGGQAFTCLLTPMGTVYCSVSHIMQPHIMDGLVATKLAVGSANICISTTTGAAFCSGYTSYGGLGQGESSSGTFYEAFQQVYGLTSDVVSVWAGPGMWGACATFTNSSAVCWGDDDYGQHGDGTISPDNLYPNSFISGITGITSMGNMYPATCVEFGQGDVQCVGKDYYGANSGGMLGNDALFADSLVLVPVVFPEPACPACTCGNDNRRQLKKKTELEEWTEKVANLEAEVIQLEGGKGKFQNQREEGGGATKKKVE